MKLKTCLIPVNGYDLRGLSAWLERQAGEGLRYVFAVGPFAQFRREEPRQVQVHLEPAHRGEVEEQRELAGLYEEQGWEFWGDFKGGYYVFAADGARAEAHTQTEIEEYALKRLSGRLKWKIFGVALALAFWGWMVWQRFEGLLNSFELRFAPVYTLLTFDGPWWMLPVLAALGLGLLSMVWGLTPLYRMIFALHSGEEDQEPPRRRGGGWLKAAWLCLALVPVFWACQTRYEGSTPVGELREPYGYVCLEELEQLPGFTASDFMFQDLAGQRRSTFIPNRWYSREWGGYDNSTTTTLLENGNTVTTYAPKRYYLATEFLGCRSEGLAKRIFEEQGHWVYFRDGQRLDYPGFDELVVNLERGGETIPLEGELTLRVDGERVPLELKPIDLNRWNLYGRSGSRVLLVEYRGSGDLREFLPRFAEMIERL